MGLDDFELACCLLILMAVRLFGVKPIKWGFSSAGRAPALQAGGQRFDPVKLHQGFLGVIASGRLDFKILVFEEK